SRFTGTTRTAYTNFGRCRASLVMVRRGARGKKLNDDLYFATWDRGCARHTRLRKGSGPASHSQRRAAAVADYRGDGRNRTLVRSNSFQPICTRMAHRRDRGRNLQGGETASALR